MDHPIKRLRFNIETCEVRFETSAMRHIDLMDYLGDLVDAATEAYEQASCMPYQGCQSFRFATGELSPR